LTELILKFIQKANNVTTLDISLTGVGSCMGKPPHSPNIAYTFTDELPVVPTLPIDMRLQ